MKRDSEKIETNYKIFDGLEEFCETQFPEKKLEDFNIKLRDYYILSSYNSCVGGNTYQDWVDNKKIKKNIKFWCKSG